MRGEGRGKREEGDDRENVEERQKGEERPNGKEIEWRGERKRQKKDRWTSTQEMKRLMWKGAGKHSNSSCQFIFLTYTS